MRAGSAYGGDARPALGISVFLDDEGGYTTVAVAVALCVSLTLVFCVAAAGWMLSRAAEVQEVADATALAGENVVAGYATIVQVLDACVLSLGLAGALVAGAGMVVSAVPGLSAAGKATATLGTRMLEARQRFATSAARGLQSIEEILPLLVLTRSARCIEANSSSGTKYVGCALPFPVESQSDFSHLDDGIDAESMEQTSEELQQASDEAERAGKEARAALEEGWRADCVDDPSCLRGRAASLAGLDGADNPSCAGPEDWNFGVPLARARAYYAARAAAEVPTGTDVESRADSAVRSAFYGYALDRVRAGHYRELPDGSVDMDLPMLPRNRDEMRTTTLYTDCRWPTTEESSGRVIHAYAGCPGATGSPGQVASLADLEAGTVARCDVCQFDAVDMGSVAAASTSIDNGFEHYWRIVCKASERYEDAHDAEQEAQRRMREISERGASAFDEAMRVLSVARPTLCPPGAWGCVAVVARSQARAIPGQLTSAFVPGQRLPGGLALSAAVLAPDGGTEENNLLAHFCDGLCAGAGSGSWPIGNILEIWGSLLVGYGSAYGEVSDTAGRFFDGIDRVFGGTAAASLRDRLKDIVRQVGFEPADLRLRKPVLTNSDDVLTQAGYDSLAEGRRLVESLPSDGTPQELAEALGRELASKLEGQTITVAELPIPGTDITIPLTLEVGDLL